MKTLDFKKLELQEVLDKLQQGATMVIRGVEATTKGDILVRLDPRNVPVTQISHNVLRGEESDYFAPYWVVYDIPFNYFVTRDVFEFTEDYRAYSPKYTVGDVVKYNHDDGLTVVEDTAIVERVIVEEGDEPEYYYKLSRVDYNVREDKLNKV